MYIQACYWSFGASIVDEARSKFDEYIKSICGFMLAQDTPAKRATASKLLIKRNKLIDIKKLIKYQDCIINAFFSILVN